MLALIDFTLSLGDLIVGIGTLALAFVTWQLVKATAASVEALDLPFLIAAPGYEGAFAYRPDDPTADDPDFDWALSVAVTNLGSGPAILDGIQMHSKTESKPLLKGKRSGGRRASGAGGVVMERGRITARGRP